MPLVRRWKRLGFAGQLTVLLSVSMIVIAALVIALVAIVSANSAGRQAKLTATCVNDVLQDRNGPAAKDAAAHVAYAAADQAFSQALERILTLPKPEARAALAAAVENKKTADDIYVRTLTDDQKARNANPFGRC